MKRSSLMLATLVTSSLMQAQSSAIAARGDAAWDAKRYPEAKAAYDSVVRADSNASSRAVYRLGVLRSWDNELRQAIALHRLYVRLEPRDLEGRVGLARVYSWDSRFAAAIATYDTVLAREADYRDAAMGRAIALAWSGNIDGAIAAYDAWLKTHPSDTEAEKGIARVMGWRGDLERSEELWRAATVKYPADAEAWVGLGQVLRWLGRPFAARDALEQALKVKPDNVEARSQLQWVRSELEWSVAPAIVANTDSERNDAVVTTLAADGPLGQSARVSLRTAFRNNTAPSAAGASQVARIGAQWQGNQGRTSVRADIGASNVSFTPAGVATRSFSPFVGGARVRTQLAQRVTAGAGVSRDLFDDVVSTMREQLVITTVDADIAVSLPARVALSGYVASSGAAGDTIESNSRMSFGGSARWTVRRGITLALNARTAAWSHPAYGAYFAPQRFSVAELAARWERTADLGLMASAEIGAGRQSIRFEQDPASARLTPRGTVTLGWRAAPGREVMLTALRANVASPGTVANSDYHYSAITLGARFTR